MIAGYAGLIAAAWAAIALSGGVDSGDLRLTATATAAASGAAALAATVRPATAVGWWLTAAGASLVPAAVAWAASGQNAAGLMVILAPLAGAATAGHDRLPRTALTAFVGAVLVAVAAFLSVGGLHPFELVPDGSSAAALFVAGGALVATAAMAAPSGDLLRLLAVPGLVIALSGVADAPERAVAILAAGSAVVVAATTRRVPPALGLLAIAAAAVPSAAPAPRLLAAAAVLSAALDTPLATVAVSMPGMVALGSTLAAAELSLRSGATTGGAIVLLAVMAGAVFAARPRLDVTATPVAVLGAWLVLLPTTWRWAGPAPGAVAIYEEGALQATAVGLIAAVAVGVLAQLRRPPVRRLEPASL